MIQHRRGYADAASPGRSYADAASPRRSYANAASPRRGATGAALVVLLHAALLWLALRPAHTPVPQDPWIWLAMPSPSYSTMPPVRLPSAVDVPASAPPPRTSLQGRAPRAFAPPPDNVTPQAAPATAQSTAPMQGQPGPTDSPEERALTATPATAPDEGLMQRALKGVGEIDRQLRREHPQQFTAPPDTPHTRLIRGFEAAHAAVDPKWYERARTQLISAPNDPRRIYRVTTAVGEYCLYYPDKASMSTNDDAKSGHAEFGQPTMAGCPHYF